MKLSATACTPPAALLLLTTVCAFTIALSGCGLKPTSKPGPVTSPVSSLAAQMQGTLHGGQQPVGGVTLQLYAAGTTGYGSAFVYSKGSSLLGNQIVTTTAAGNFNLPLPACPTPQTPIFLVATGGYPIPGAAPNANLALMTALGPCGNLSSSTYIAVNELTTVAAVWALSPFMSAPTMIGSSATNLVGLTNAFATVNKLVNISTGKLPGLALPVDAVLPVSELNSLANILAVCVNSTGGVAGDGSPCGTLFSLAPSAAGIAPTDTITAAWNIAQNPTQNTAALQLLSTPAAPFQPTLASAPAAWTLAIKHKANGTFVNPSDIAADQAGNLWITNRGNNSVTEIASSGAVLSGSPGFAAGQAGGGALVIDQTGRAWVPGVASGTLLQLTGSSVTAFTGGGLSTTKALAVDAQGQIWAVGNSSTLSVFSSDGTPVSPSTGFPSADQTAVQSAVMAPF